MDLAGEVAGRGGGGRNDAGEAALSIMDIQR